MSESRALRIPIPSHSLWHLFGLEPDNESLQDAASLTLREVPHVVVLWRHLYQPGKIRADNIELDSVF